VSKNLPFHYLFYVNMNIHFCFYVNSARDVVTILLIFANYLSLYLHTFTCTYRGTHTQAHMYNRNGDNQEQEPWLGGAEERPLLETKAHTHTKRRKHVRKKRYSRIKKKRFEHIDSY